METTASAKGQVVIPAPLRRKFGIKGGTRIQVYEEEGRIILEPLTREQIHKLRGVFKGCGALDILMEERRREREG